MYGPMRRVHSAGDMSPDDEPLLYVRTVWSPLMPSVFIVCSFTHSMFFLKLHSTARVLVEPVAMTLSLTDGWILWTLVVFSEMFYSNRMLEWKHLWSYGGFIYWDVAELFSLNWSQEVTMKKWNRTLFIENGWCQDTYRKWKRLCNQIKTSRMFSLYRCIFMPQCLFKVSMEALRLKRSDMKTSLLCLIYI